jgi:RecB family exonuclease
MAPDPSTYSFSRVTTFEQCARRFRYRYLDGVQEGFQGVEGFMGTQVHSALEWLFEQRDAGHKKTVEQAVAYYCDEWDRCVTNAAAPVRVVKTGTPMETYRRNGAEMLSRYYRERFLSDRLTTVANEHHFLVTLGDRLRFQGFIDRLATDEKGLLHIIDYKTGSRVPKKFDGKEAQQLEAYAMAMFREGEAEEIELVLDFLKTGARLRRRVARADAEEIEARLIARIDKAEEANVFPPTPGVLCGWCGYNDVCESAMLRYSRAS